MPSSRAAIRRRARIISAWNLTRSLTAGEHFWGEALALYGRSGFSRIPLFGEYIGSPLSVCMAKDLSERSWRFV